MNASQRGWEDEHLEEIKQLEKSMDGIIRILKVAVREPSVEYWAPHAPQFLYAIDRFQNRCRDEIKRFGECARTAEGRRGHRYAG